VFHSIFANQNKHKKVVLAWQGERGEDCHLIYSIYSTLIVPELGTAKVLARDFVKKNLKFKGFQKTVLNSFS
jgi:hypothetical protein